LKTLPLPVRAAGGLKRRVGEVRWLKSIDTGIGLSDKAFDGRWRIDSAGAAGRKACFIETMA